MVVQVVVEQEQQVPMEIQDQEVLLVPLVVLYQIL